MRPDLLVLALVPALALAQPDRSGVDRLPQGDLALVAALTNVSLTNLNPTLVGVGARYGATDRTVVGATIGLSGSATDGDAEEDGYGVNTVVWSETHLGPRGRRVSPFVGAQVSGRRSDWTYQQPTCSRCAPLERQATHTGGSVGVVGGAELLVLRGLSLSAAMWLGASYDARQVREDLPDGTSRVFDQSGVRFGTGGTALRLSIYL